MIFTFWTIVTARLFILSPRKQQIPHTRQTYKSGNPAFPTHPVIYIHTHTRQLSHPLKTPPKTLRDLEDSSPSHSPSHFTRRRRNLISVQCTVHALLHSLRAYNTRAPLSHSAALSLSLSLVRAISSLEQLERVAP